MKLRFVCRIYFETSKRRREVDPAFINCPTECPNGAKYFDAYRTKKCETCPYREIRDSFKQETENLIFEFFGEKEAAKFRFDNFEAALYSVISLSDLPPEKMSVKTNALFSVYEKERQRFDRIEEIEREANQPKY